MHTRIAHHLMAALFCVVFTAELTAQPTAFTYQGQFADSGIPATGLFDFEFMLYDSSGGLTVVGGPITNSATVVSNGLFTVVLDFGAGVFDGNDRWLEIGVVTNGGGAFTTLNPRQQITSAPYAITAGNLTGALPSGGFAGTYTEAVTLNNAANNFNGSFAGDGAGVANVDAATLEGLGASDFWQLAGNAGTTAGTHFLGTTDDEPLEFKVNNQRGLRLVYGTNEIGPGFVTLIGGYNGNVVATDAVGSVIAGGGAIGLANSVGDGSFLSVIGGGAGNEIVSNAVISTIAGGFNNRVIGGDHASIGGGYQNAIYSGGNSATIGGGSANHIASSSPGATIAGGAANTNGVSSWYGTIGGGLKNTITSNSFYPVISGGRFNYIGADSSLSSIGGGDYNSIGSTSERATIAGGSNNSIGSNSIAATIAGGLFNVVGANGGYGYIGGGLSNIIADGAQLATIPGGVRNSIGTGANYAFAAGQRAQANHQGTFVWADSTAADFPSGANDQFLIRAAGGVGIGKTNPATALDVNGTVTADSFAGDGSGLTGLDGAQLAFGSVGNAALAADSVTSAKIMDGSIIGADIAVNTITALNLAANSVGASEIASDAVGTSEIADGAITTNDLNSDVLNSTFWRLHGNAGTTAGTHFLGTADSEPFEIKVDGMRALRFENNGDGSDSLTIPDGAPNVIAGSPNNSVAAGVVGATISGGGATNYAISQLNSPHSIAADYATIGGGLTNTILSGATGGTVGGGGYNALQTGAFYSTIGGGAENTIQINASYATVGGGRQNNLQTNSDNSVIGGGLQNTIQADATSAIIGGGEANTIRSDSTYSTISGGIGNTIETNVVRGVIGGGGYNTIGAGAWSATIAGGRDNTIQAGAAYSMIPGGRNNAVGSVAQYAFAAGRQAKANHQGTFVWADSTAADFNSTTNNQFNVRAAGGTRIFSDSGATVGVELLPGANAWSVLSDRNAKKNFETVDGLAILDRLTQIPVQRWNYKSEADDAVPHIGPMAQDFKAAFYPGRNGRTISTLEFDGVALAAIQGLNQKLERENAELRKELQEIKQLLSRITKKGTQP